MNVQTETGVTEVWADGGRLDTALPRLDYAAGLIERRRSALRAETGARYVGDAFRVHLMGSVSALIVDDVTRGLLETCALYGEKYGVVVLVHAPSRNSAARMLAGSAPLLDAFNAGSSVRLVEGRGAPGLGGTSATRAADALLAAARLVVGERTEDLAAAFDQALAGDTEAARSALARALYFAVDLIDSKPSGVDVVDSKPDGADK